MSSVQVTKRFAQRVSQLRKRCGMTQSDLGERIGRTVKTVSAIERGRLFPPLDTLLALCHAFDTTISELTAGIDGTQLGRYQASPSPELTAAIAKARSALDEIARVAAT
jgi:DNA-binding XRE family transcriptional regulator